MRRVVLSLLIASAAGCAPRTPPMATAGDASRANVELAQLHEGRKLLMGKCAGCHKTPMPDEHTAAEWPRMLDEMADRSNLDLAQRALIERYLVSMATK